MSPRKVILAIIITGIIIVASVGGIFYLADSGGLFNAKVRVYGYAEGSNATRCSLYVDGVKVATETLGYGYYGYPYNDQSYTFEGIEVKANTEHDFQVITSDGEESDVTTEYVPYGQHTYLYINIIKEKVPVYIRGIYNGSGTGTGSTQVYLYVDGQNTDQSYVTAGNTFYFTTQVFTNEYHSFRVTASFNMTQYENETTEYIDSAKTIWLNLG